MDLILKNHKTSTGILYILDQHGNELAEVFKCYDGVNNDYEDKKAEYVHKLFSLSPSLLLRVRDLVRILDSIKSDIYLDRLEEIDLEVAKKLLEEFE